MFKHVFKLIWNRKGSNALIIVELLLAFLVVFGVAGTGAYYLYLYQQPLGFDYEDTWSVRIATGEEWTEQDGELMQQVLPSIRALPEVEWAHIISIPLFQNSRWSSPVTNKDKEVDTYMNYVSPGAPQDMGMELLEGRWFGPEDEGSEEQLVLINQRLKQELFGDASPLGVDIRQPNPEAEEPLAPRRVIGVISDFRQWGELQQLANYVMIRFPLENKDWPVRSIQLKLRPDTSPEFEEQLLKLVEGIAPNWNLSINTAESMRASIMRERTIPLSISSVLAGFLLIMVVFGMFGVLWQSVTRRTSELGLRRAVGATKHRVYTQIVMETVVLALLAVIAGSLIAIQFPLLAPFPALGWSTSIVGILIAAGIIVGICALCAMYPAWLASRRDPADALHFE